MVWKMEIWDERSLVTDEYVWYSVDSDASSYIGSDPVNEISNYIVIHT